MNELVEVKSLLRDSLVKLSKESNNDTVKAVQELYASVGSKSKVLQIQVVNINNNIVINNIDKALNILDGYSPSLGVVEKKKSIVRECVDFYGAVDDYKKELIVEALNSSGGVVMRAARLLNMERTTLQEMIKRFKIKSNWNYYVEQS